MTPYQPQELPKIPSRPKGIRHLPEKDLQAQCERMLQIKGYARRTPKQMMPGSPPPLRGWFAHIHRAQGNPLFLDILILGNDGRYLEVELKVAGGRYSDHQKALIQQGAKAACTLQGFIDILEAWGKDKP